MKIYTKTGDAGKTGLYGGARLYKDDIRIEAYGTVDELNSSIALITTFFSDSRLDKMIFEIQSRLFTIGAHLATDPSKAIAPPDILEKDIVLLETEIDWMNAKLTPLRAFILPNGSKAIAFAHMARTICRRAERRVVSLLREESTNGHSELLIKYLNRLSDYLFTLARYIADCQYIAEHEWHPRKIK